jgi:hypothetical protein
MRAFWRSDEEDVTSGDVTAADIEAEETTTSWKYWRVTVRMLGASKYSNELTWNFGHDQEDPDAEKDAIAFGAQIFGDGTGNWISTGGHTRIRRETITHVNVHSSWRYR